MPHSDTSPNDCYFLFFFSYVFVYNHKSMIYWIISWYDQILKQTIVLKEIIILNIVLKYAWLPSWVLPEWEGLI